MMSKDMEQGDMEQAPASPARPSRPSAAAPSHTPWRVAAGDKRYVFAPGIAKPINVGSVERATFIVKAVNSHQQLVDALNRIAAPHDCGCWPCTGQCRSQEALQITVDAMRDIAEAALTATEA